MFTLGKEYARWSATAEVFFALNAGIAIKDLRPYVGRAIGPRFQVRPMCHEHRAISGIYYSQEAQQWASMEISITMVSCHMSA